MFVKINRVLAQMIEQINGWEQVSPHTTQRFLELCESLTDEYTLLESLQEKYTQFPVSEIRKLSQNSSPAFFSATNNCGLNFVFTSRQLKKLPRAHLELYFEHIDITILPIIFRHFFSRNLERSKLDVQTGQKENR